MASDPSAWERQIGIIKDRSDIKKIASSETAIEELSNNMEDIRQVQSQTREDDERI